MNIFLLLRSVSLQRGLTKLNVINPINAQPADFWFIKFRSRLNVEREKIFFRASFRLFRKDANHYQLKPNAKHKQI